MRPDFSDYEYRIVEDYYLAKSNWYDGRAYCMEQGGDLTSIWSKEEGAFIQRWVRRLSYSTLSFRVPMVLYLFMLWLDDVQSME